MCERYREVPVLSVNNVTCNRHLQTTVADLTIIYHTAVGTQCRVHKTSNEQVATMAVVVFDITTNQILEKTEVKTNVGRGSLLPTQFRIRQVITVVVKIGQSLTKRLQTGAHLLVFCHEIGCAGLIHITIHTIGGTQFQIAQP